MGVNGDGISSSLLTNTDKMRELCMGTASDARPDLQHVRELYDGMAIVIKQDGRISEFIEHVLRDLSGGEVVNVRVAVRNAHNRLGLTQ